MTATIPNHTHTDLRNPTQRYKKGKVQFKPQSLRTHTQASHTEQSFSLLVTHNLKISLSFSRSLSPHVKEQAAIKPFMLYFQGLESKVFPYV